MQTRSARLHVLTAFVVMLPLLLVNACKGQAAKPDASAETDFTHTATIKDIMQGIVDPSADEVWGAVYTVVSPAGVEEKVPQTDEEWAKARLAAIRIAEATNLLIMPGRHVARPGEKSETPGVELEPAQMEELIKKDPQGFKDRAKALLAASQEAVKAIEARDTKEMVVVGEKIDGACENCHVHYWYPNQKLPPGYEEPSLRK